MTTEAVSGGTSVAPRERVRALHPPGVGEDLELVPLPLEGPGPEELPDAEVVEPAHRGRPALPSLEVADDPDGRGPGCPHGERDAVDAVDRLHVRAEVVPELLVASLTEQVQVEFADRRREAVGVVRRPGDVVGVAGGVRVVVGLDAVPAEHALGRAGPEAVALVRQLDVVAVGAHDAHRPGQVPDDADARTAVDGVRPEDVVGLRPAGLGDLLAEPLLDGSGPRTVRRGSGGRPRDHGARAVGGSSWRAGVGERCAALGRGASAPSSTEVVRWRGCAGSGACPASVADSGTPRSGASFAGAGAPGRSSPGADTRGSYRGSGAPDAVAPVAAAPVAVAPVAAVGAVGASAAGARRAAPGASAAGCPRASAVATRAAAGAARAGRSAPAHGRAAAVRAAPPSRVLRRLVGVGHRCGPSTTSRCTGSWKASRRT